ncbi:MAG TPA: cell division protein ZapA [Rhizomicrobium sp.]|nr:cell division protein ZapA [Rhizomicrobium sp.]
MPLVNVMVNGRTYTIACDEGEEDHLRELAATVDAKAREVLSSVGQVGDARLLLMAAILIADEHHGGKENAVDETEGNAALKKELAECAAAEAQAGALLERTASRLEQIAASLSAA